MTQMYPNTGLAYYQSPISLVYPATNTPYSPRAPNPFSAIGGSQMSQNGNKCCNYLFLNSEVTIYPVKNANFNSRCILNLELNHPTNLNIAGMPFGAEYQPVKVNGLNKVLGPLAAGNVSLQGFS